MGGSKTILGHLALCACTDVAVVAPMKIIGIGKIEITAAAAAIQWIPRAQRTGRTIVVLMNAFMPGNLFAYFMRLARVLTLRTHGADVFMAFNLDPESSRAIAAAGITLAVTVGV